MILNVPAYDYATETMAIQYVKELVLLHLHCKITNKLFTSMYIHLNAGKQMIVTVTKEILETILCGQIINSK